MKRWPELALHRKDVSLVNEDRPQLFPMPRGDRMVKTLVRLNGAWVRLYFSLLIQAINQTS